MDRNSNLKNVEATELWDLLVIGGGATGLGAALDAASRGMKVLLIEKFDFAKGTSSRSTKLIHGGVRYLRNGDITLVKKALKERFTLQKNAPHLVKNLDFIIPIYSWLDFLFYGSGLLFYDLIAGKWSFGRTKILNKTRTRKLLQGISANKLKGGIQYQDGQFDDARYAITVAQSIHESGSICVNYMEYLSLQVTNSTSYEVLIRDQIHAVNYQIKTKYIVNATGVFGSEVFNSSGQSHTIRASRGSHIVLDRSFLPSNSALMVPKTSDGRVLFAIPWNNYTLVGTTDHETKNLSIETKVPKEDIDFILANIQHYLTKQPEYKDIKSVFSGLRPLVSISNSKSTKTLSRDHVLHQSTDGVLHILGGKWTTYRLMGEEAIDKLLKNDPNKFSKSKTTDLKLHGYEKTTNFQDQMHVYGSHKKTVEKCGKTDSLSDQFLITEAMVIYAIQNEMAQTVEDVLARRIRGLFLNAKETMRLAPMIAKIMANYLNKDSYWEKKQSDLFILLASNYNL